VNETLWYGTGRNTRNYESILGLSQSGFASSPSPSKARSLAARVVVDSLLFVTSVALLTISP